MQPVSRYRIITLALLAMCGPLMAAKVQMWKDASGNTHYGDSPPPGSSTQTVSVNAAPPSSNPQPSYTPPPTTPAAAGKPEVQDAQNAQTEKRAREDKAAAAEARNQALRDKAVVDSCRTRRERYCNEGADAIRQKDYEHAQMQAADQQSAAMAQGRVIPPGQRITPVNPCQWPQPCGTSKKK
jgi:hypothetical protein